MVARIIRLCQIPRTIMPNYCICILFPVLALEFTRWSPRHTPCRTAPTVREPLEGNKTTPDPVSSTLLFPNHPGNGCTHTGRCCHAWTLPPAVPPTSVPLTKVPESRRLAMTRQQADRAHQGDSNGENPVKFRSVVMFLFNFSCLGPTVTPSAEQLASLTRPGHHQSHLSAVAPSFSFSMGK